MLLEKLNRWIDQTIDYNQAYSQPCDCFKNEFLGYFHTDFLRKCRFVVTDTLPFPEFDSLYKIGLESLITDQNMPAIAYKQMYFIYPDYQHDLSIHLHELIHTCQWQLMGIWFLKRYLDELQGDQGALFSLEQQAMEISCRYVKGEQPIDVKSIIYSQM